jgi:uncharacterized membrane protein
MKKLVYQSVFLVLLLSLIMASCSSGNRMGGSSKKCGCGMNRGYVGY